MTLEITPPIDILSQHALFLDFDGTLAPLQDNPKTVAMPAASYSAIPRLFTAMQGALAVVSGRDIRDLTSRVPSDVWRVGGHGVSVCEPDEPAPQELVSSPEELNIGFESIVERFDGVWCEFKGPIIAVHYRQAPDVKDELGAGLAAVIEQISGYKLQAGKMVFEAKPFAANKGRAIESLMQQAPFKGRIPIMLGDDATDEDGFAVVIEMGGFAVKVGEGDSLAQYRLETPAAVSDWLQKVESGI